MLTTQQPCLTCWPMRGYVTTSPSHVHSLQPLTTSGRSAGDPSSVSSVPCLSLADKSCLPKREWPHHIVPRMPAHAVATVALVAVFPPLCRERGHCEESALDSF